MSEAIIGILSAAVVIVLAEVVQYFQHGDGADNADPGSPRRKTSA